MKSPVLILWLTLVSLCAAASGQNLIQNPSFEAADSINSQLAANWQLYGSGYGRYLASNAWDGQAVARVAADPAGLAGLWQRVTLNQTKTMPVLITAWVKGFDIPNDPADIFGACLYLEIHLADGTTIIYSPNTNRTKNVGTFEWRKIGINTWSIGVTEPVTFIDVYLMIGKLPSGSAWFDDVQAVEYDPSAAKSGAVSVIVDDGESSTLVAYQGLADRGIMAGTAAVVTGTSTGEIILPGYVGTDNHLTWDQLKDMEQHGWEIDSHSATHVDLTTNTLTPDRIWAELHYSKVELEAHGLHPKNFIWPYGAYDQDLIALAEWDYRSMRGVEEGFNPMGVFPYDIRIQEVDSDIPLQTVFGWIDYAKANHVWLVLVFHSIVNPPHDDIYYCTPATFYAIADHLKTSGLPVVTYNRGLDLFTDPTTWTRSAATGWTFYE